MRRSCCAISTAPAADVTSLSHSGSILGSCTTELVDSNITLSELFLGIALNSDRCIFLRIFVLVGRAILHEVAKINIEFRVLVYQARLVVRCRAF